MIFLFYPCIFNKQGKQTNKNSQTQTTAWWLPEGRGWEVVRGKGGQTHGGGTRCDFGWQHTMQYIDDVS